jgi:hypothetical protein
VLQVANILLAIFESSARLGDVWHFPAGFSFARPSARANPSKVEDFGDRDLLQHIDLARILFGEVIPPSREAR